MSAAYLHLILNHIPVVGLGAAILLLLYAIAKKQVEVIKVTFGGFVLLALVTIPVYLTGEPTEHIVEHLPGVSESIIEQHEEAATLSLIALELLGAAGVAGLFFFRRLTAVPKWFAVLSLVMALVAAGLVSWTANLGGQIRHTEIRTGSSAAGTDDEAEDQHERNESRNGKKQEDR